MSKLLDISCIKRTDGYKFCHWEMFPKGVTEIDSYLESRGGKYNEIVAWGNQYITKENFEGQVFTLQDIADLDYGLKHYFNPGWDGKTEVRNFFNKKGFTEMYESYGGCLPLRIRALPEGTVARPKNMLLKLTNTDPRFPWLPDYLEPIAEKAWFGCTVATFSRELKKMIKRHWIKTGCIDDIAFKMHGFGDRSSTSGASSTYSGAAHLLNFLGTDTYQANEFLIKYYNAILPISHSVPATEHLITMLWGREGQFELFKYLLSTYPGYIHSSVTDTWDHFKAISNDYKRLESEIIANNNTGGSLVMRPDTVIQEFIQLFELLFRTFGYTNNRKGYKVSSLGIKLLCGNAVSYESADQLLTNMEQKGISIDNIVFGMGGNLDQKHNRDDAMFAFKGSKATIYGEKVDLYKDPITETFKKSKKGNLIVVKNSEGDIETISDCDIEPDEFKKLSNEDLMEDIFINGEMVNESSLSEVRDRVKI